MSERIVDNPANHGWVEENGKWVWEGGATTGHIEDGTIDGQITTWDVAKTEWTPEGAMVVSGGSVGIGTAAPAAQFEVKGSNTNARFRGVGSQLMNFNFNESPSTTEIDVRNSGAFNISKQGVPALTIDNSRNATFSGNVSSETGRFLRPSGNCGITISAEAVYPDNGTGNLGSDGLLNIGGGDNRFKDAYFSGTVSANTLETSRASNGVFFTMTQGASNSRLAHEGGNSLSLYPLGSQFNVNGTVDAAGFTVNGVPIGGGGGLPDGGYTYNYQFAAPTSIIAFVNGKLSNSIKAEASAVSAYQNTLAHTDYGLEFQSNSSSRAWKFTNAGGDRVVISTGGNVTATDFIATSDERAKDNITTAPTGILEQLHGREWDWRESGEKGSGVVAQELEQVLPHLVHEDDEGMKSVSYNGLVAYLIEEVKALRAEVEALK